MKFDDCLYCDICTSYVKETSRHCKVCQRYDILLRKGNEIYIMIDVCNNLIITACG